MKMALCLALFGEPVRVLISTYHHTMHEIQPTKDGKFELGLVDFGGVN